MSSAGFKAKPVGYAVLKGRLHQPHEVPIANFAGFASHELP